MSGLRQALSNYLSLRRSLGYGLERYEKLLLQFIDYLETVGGPTITTEHALAWACQPKNTSKVWWARRLSAVRGFTNYLRAQDSTVEVVPPDVLPYRSNRACPYLYRDREIAALLEAAGTLYGPLHVATYQTLIGLLAVTGMRVGEAIGLDLQDFDASNGVLVIRHAKFNKTREVPLHLSTVAALRRYVVRARRQRSATGTAALLVSNVGTRLIYSNVHRTFAGLARHTGLVARTTRCRPRIHDLRHTFAVNTLLDAHRDGADVHERLTVLSTYLGHVNPSDTYWYLSAAPELLAQVADRLEFGARP